MWSRNLPSRNDLYFLKYFKRKQVTAVASNDNWAIAFDRTFQDPVVSWTSFNDVNSFNRHDNFGDCKQWRGQFLDLFIGESKFIGFQNALRLVHQHRRRYPGEPSGKGRVYNLKRDAAKEQRRNGDIGVNDGADQDRFRISERTASTSEALRPFFLRRFETVFLVCSPPEDIR